LGKRLKKAQAQKKREMGRKKEEGGKVKGKKASDKYMQKRRISKYFSNHIIDFCCPPLFILH
jgi:hypothetical protein